MPYRMPTALDLSGAERAELQGWSRRRRTAQGLALRARIVLRAAEGLSNTAIADELGVAKHTVGKWRERFAVHRLEGLRDEPRSGAPRTVTDERVAELLVRTLETTPGDATHWSTRAMAAACGLSPATVQRVWRAFGLKPHRAGTSAFSSDPAFVDKVRDVVGPGCTSPLRTAPWSRAWTRRPRCRPSSAPSPSCRCARGSRSGAPRATSGTGPRPCSPPWTSRPAG